MIFLTRRVFTLIALCMASGIAFANICNAPVNPHLLSVFATVCIIASAVLFSTKNTSLTVIGLFLSCSLLGAARLWSERDLVLSSPIVEIAESSSGQHEITGHVVGFPRLGGEYVRAIVSVDGIDGVNSSDSLGRIMLFWRSEGDRDLLWGDEVRLYASIRVESPPRNPGEFDYRMYLLDRGAAVTAFAFGANGLTRTGKRGPVMQSYSDLRKLLFSKLAERQQSPYSEILISLVYGDKTTELDPVVKEEFRRAGMTHILVVSGTQVSLIVFLLICLLSPGRDDLARRGIVNRILVGSAIIFAVFFYCTLTGFETSVLRAFVMGIMMLLARLMQRETDGFGELARSAIIILAVQPGQIFGASFQLSFVACFGLIYIYSLFGTLVTRIRFRFLRFTLVTLITTAGAQLFVAPILAAHFNQFSFWGLPANLLAIPLASVLLLVGVLHNIIAFIAPEFITAISAYVLSFGLSLLQGLAHFFGNLSGSDTRVASPTPIVIACFYVLVLSAGELFRRRRRIVEFVRSAYQARTSISRTGVVVPVRRLSTEIHFLSILMVVSLIGLFTAFSVSQPDLPRAVILSAGDSLSMILQVDNSRAYAIIKPTGGELVRRNQIRAVKELLDHYGVKKPAGVYFLSDPGEKGKEEADLFWSGLYKKFTGNNDSTKTAESSKPANERILFKENGLNCAAYVLFANNERYVLFIEAPSRKIAVFIGNTTQTSILETLREKGVPDVLCVKSGTTLNTESLLRKLTSPDDPLGNGQDSKSLNRVPEVVQYGRYLNRAVEIRLARDREGSPVLEIDVRV